jgi:hypothetical protein
MIEIMLGTALGIALFIGAVVLVVAFLAGAFDFKTNRIRREQARRLERERLRREQARRLERERLDRMFRP